MFDTSTLLGVLVFIGTCSTLTLIVNLVHPSAGRGESRLRDLFSTKAPTKKETGVRAFAQSALPHVGSPLLPADGPERTPTGQLVPELSARMDAVILKSVSADPTLRPASCRDFIASLMEPARA